MKGYVIANIDVTDDDAYGAYRARTPEVIAQYGGRFLVRGGAIEVMEGDPGLQRLVSSNSPASKTPAASTTARNIRKSFRSAQPIPPARCRSSPAFDASCVESTEGDGRIR